MDHFGDLMDDRRYSGGTQGWRPTDADILNGLRKIFQERRGRAVVRIPVPASWTNKRTIEEMGKIIGEPVWWSDKDAMSGFVSFRESGDRHCSACGVKEPPLVVNTSKGGKRAFCDWRCVSLFLAFMGVSYAESKRLAELFDSAVRYA